MVGGTGGIAVVGEPLAFGVGFIALLLVGFSTIVGQYFTTLAHEGGHALIGYLLQRPVRALVVKDDTSGYTDTPDVPYSFGNLLVFYAGYAAPSAFGLGAAALVANGQVVSVLLATLFLGLLALLATRGGLGTLLSLLVIVGAGYVFLYGSAGLQAAVAVGIAWFLLIAGLVDAWNLPIGSGRSDAERLAQKTWIPAGLWKLSWVVLALVALYVGGRLLLVPGA
jgi:hypothetical protein